MHSDYKSFIPSKEPHLNCKNHEYKNQNTFVKISVFVAEKEKLLK
ncbi:hypothetical protein SAMN04487995_3768 [Dyadobacter koreensis]|uniref:Uncharacterized protein n=1 Tax=Dyadobacter koreensis TaxID=408657 RepID=A0A1H6WXS3_9BACT|nr:hypothetical protein SAMN04487995_3768 [Dyadobacter koreensis]